MAEPQSRTRGILPIRYDAVVKDLVQRDSPSFLHQRFLGGRAIRAFLNVEFAVVEERVADLVLELDDGSLFHIEFQSDNDSAMPYRMGIYGLLIGRNHRGRDVAQVVIYLGPDPMTMPASVIVGGITVGYDVMDIRELTAAELLASGRPGDYALALLARGGVAQLRAILEHAQALEEPERSRVFTQIALLAGLRGASEQFRMEMKAMGVHVDIEQNVVLKEIYDTGFEKGSLQGRELGLQQGRQNMAKLLCRLVEQRFGPLPEWASARILGASNAEIEQWASQVLSAPTLEAALGR